MKKGEAPPTPEVVTLTQAENYDDDGDGDVPSTLKIPRKNGGKAFYVSQVPSTPKKLLGSLLDGKGEQVVKKVLLKKIKDFPPKICDIVVIFDFQGRLEEELMSTRLREVEK